jgi:transcriptional regulator with XRE-family HTH domain
MNTTELGTAIRNFRLRHRQIHNGQPWTLEDLAVAIGSDKAHVPRYEHGQTLPNQPTVFRIAHALELSWQETEYLLRLSGHAPVYDVPDAEAIRKAVGWVARTVREYLHPIGLYSVDPRVWYTNALWLRVHGLAPGAFRVCIRGRSAVERTLGPCTTQDHLAARNRDWEAVKRRVLARFWAFNLGSAVPEEVAELQRDPSFRNLWEAAEAAAPQLSFPGEQAVKEVEYPGRGLLRFDTWWCPLQIDRRFLVVHHIPHDRRTREALAAIRRDPRPRPGAPCPAHAEAPAPVPV